MLWGDTFSFPQGGVPLSDLLNGIGSEATSGQNGAMGAKFKVKLYGIL